jgi:hypothetical protein
MNIGGFFLFGGSFKAQADACTRWGPLVGCKKFMITTINNELIVKNANCLFESLIEKLKPIDRPGTEEF